MEVYTGITRQHADYAFIGKANNGIALSSNGDIHISTNMDSTNIYIDDEIAINLNAKDRLVTIIANDIVLDTYGPGGVLSRAVNGDELVDLLRLILKILKTHKHPPNAMPIPDFYPDVDNWLSKLEEVLLNDHVKMT